MNPTFVASEAGSLNTPLKIDLSDHRANCGPGVAPACSLYCGPGASCVVDAEGLEGCACPEGQGAVLVAHPMREGGLQPFCRPLDAASNMLPEYDEPCACGGGDCVRMSGSEVCSCPDGQAAFGDGRRLVCGAFAQTFDASVVVNDHSQDGAPSFGSGGGCAAGLGGVIEMAGLSLLALVVRRRRTRS